MAEDTATHDQAEITKQAARDALVQYVTTLLSLLAIVIVCGAFHYDQAMNTALGGFLGFATSGRPNGGVSRPMVAAMTIGLAMAAGTIHT